MHHTFRDPELGRLAAIAAAADAVMALATTTFLNAALGDATNKGGLALVTDCALCNGSPGTSSTPANECSGSGYVRVACTMGTASGAQAGNTGALSWTFSGTLAFSYVDLTSSITVGAATALIGAQLTSSQSFGSGGGTFTIAIGGLTISAS